MSEKSERAKKANDLIQVIANCGREFFKHKGLVSKIVIDRHGHIYFVDAGTKTQIYTHYTRRWRGFSEGGTLRDVVLRLCYFISTGNQTGNNTFGPWPSWYSDGDPWGYGDDMQNVHNAAVALGIIKAPNIECSGQAHAPDGAALSQSKITG